MKHVRFNITKDAYTILVEASVDEQGGRFRVPIINVYTEDVWKFLKNEGVEVSKVIHQPVVHNKREHHRKGTWIFEKKELDKTSEPVIIKEEKSVQPKPTRKKRTRSSAKKVSTED